MLPSDEKIEGIKFANGLEKNYDAKPKVDEAVENLILANQASPRFNLINYVKLMPHGDNRYMETKFVFEIKNIQRPIGITILAKAKNIVISEQGVRPDPGKVRMYQPDGSPMKILQPGQPFK